MLTGIDESLDEIDNVKKVSQQQQSSSYELDSSIDDHEIL